jgi:hypothetical protein
MASELHPQGLINYIIKKCKWSTSTFNQVHWDSHENVIPALAVYLLRKLLLMSFPMLLKGPQKTASGPYLPYRMILPLLKRRR